MQPSMFNLRVPLPARDEVFSDEHVTTRSCSCRVTSRIYSIGARARAIRSRLPSDEWEAVKLLTDNGFLVSSADVDRRR